MADYSFGSQMGLDDPDSDELGQLLTYGSNSDEDTTGQPNSEPNVKSDASAPIAPAAHVQAVSSTPPSADTAPTYNAPDPDELQAIQQQKAKDEVVTKVSPKWWERGLGGLAAGAMAFGKVPGAVEAGQNVTNRGQIEEENQRAGKLAADDVALQSWNDGQAQAQRTFQNQHTAFEDQQRAESAGQLRDDRNAQKEQRLQSVAPGSESPDDPKNPLGAWHATTVGGKQIPLEGPPDKWAKSPAGVAAQRDADVTRLKLTGDDAKYYRANGKLKEPGAVTNVHVPSEGQQAYNDAMAAWKSDNPGKKPSLADLRTIRTAADGKADAPGTKRGTPGQFGDLDKQTQAQYDKAEATFKAASTNGTDADRASALADLNAEKARIGAEHSQRLRDLGGIPAEDSISSNSQRPAAPAAPKGSVQVTDPHGGVHTFPNQAAADKFRKLAGIK